VKARNTGAEFLSPDDVARGASLTFAAGGVVFEGGVQMVRSIGWVVCFAAGLLLSGTAHADGSLRGSRETSNVTGNPGGGGIAISATESVVVGAAGEVLVASRADPMDEAQWLIQNGWIAKYLIDEEGIWLVYKNGMMRMVPYTTQTMQALTSASIENMAGGAATAAGGGVAGEAVGGASLGTGGMIAGGLVVAAELAALAYEAYLISYYNSQTAAAEQQYLNMGGTQQQIDQNNQNAGSNYWYYFWQDYNPANWF
jgi:hypothetical protein